jgi:hypothetical protein
VLPVGLALRAACKRPRSFMAVSVSSSAESSKGSEYKSSLEGIGSSTFSAVRSHSGGSIQTSTSGPMWVFDC